MSRAYHAVVKHRDQSFEIADNFGRVVAHELWMEGNPHGAYLFFLGQFSRTAQAVQVSIESEVDSAMSIGVLIQTAQKFVLSLLV